MRNRTIWMAAISIVFMGLGLSQGQPIENLLTNPGLEDGTDAGWGGYGDNTREVVQELVGAAIPGSPIEGNNCLHVTVGTDYVDFWNCGLTLWSGGVFESGKQYTVSFWAKSKQGELEINLKPEQTDTWTAYGEKRITITEEWAEYYTTSPVVTADVPDMQISVHIGFGAGEFWLDAARLYVGEYVETVFGPRVKASKPYPANENTNIPQDAILSWEPGAFAAAHDVYLGDTFDDVNDAPTMNTLDLLKSNDQPGTTYDPEGPLEFGKTYYWRIDEVNAAPDSTVFKGDVWSFTVEQFAYPITNVTATASSENIPAMGAARTVDGSGLNGDLHSTEPMDMWLSHLMGDQPTWIQFEFDQAYGLTEMWVWNQNQPLESVIGLGVKDATIEHSLDGENWTVLGDFEIARAPGAAANPPDSMIDLSGVYAQYVRLTVGSNWAGILQQFGLSEVRFFFIPVAANDPSPAVGDLDVPLDVTLDWRGGREAVTHDVYLSKDENEVIDGTALVGTVGETRFQPGNLEYGQVYYWKVNEVNDAAAVPVREGETWQFSTVENLVVDDFEGYTDDDPNGQAIWQTWIDGFGVTENGSQVGYLVPPYAEQSIVNTGRQSMPFLYENGQGSARYSEAERTFDQAQDWTIGGVSKLSLSYRGYAGSTGSFVEDPAGTFTMTGSGADIWDIGTAGDYRDEFHFAYKTLTGPGSIVARVESVENTNDWAKAGVMIRETLEPDSTHAFACVTPVSGVASQGRIDTGGSSFNTAEGGISAPHWVKLDRSISGVFTVSHSTDGSTWVPVAGVSPTNIQMGATVYIGLAVTSHDTALACQAVLSNVTTTGNVSGQWANQDIGIATNAAEPLYIGLADSAGTVGIVENEDPAAAQVSDWTVWSVDLAAFADQGVNIGAVKKMIIGAGNQAATTPGGSGALFFDDIAIGNPVVRKAPENLLTNGGFEDGIIDPWQYWGDVTAEVVQELVGAAVPEDPIEGDSCLHITVNSAGANDWDYSMVQRGRVFEAGKKYTFSAFLKTKEGTMEIRLKPERDADPWEGHGDQVLTITDQWTQYSVTTPVIAADVNPAATTFHFAFGPGEFWIDDVKFYEGETPPPSGAALTPVAYDFETGAQGWGGLKDGTAPTVSAETHSAGGSQSLSVTLDEAAHSQQEGGWAAPRDFTVDQADFAAGGYSTLSFWYRVDDADLNGGNFVLHWISSTEAWSGGGWYGNGLYGVVIADGQWHQQTVDLSILGEAAGGWQGTWGDLAAWEFSGDLFYSFEIAVSPTDNTNGSNIYIDDIVFE